MNKLKKKFDDYVALYSCSYGTKREEALDNMRQIMIERNEASSATIDNEEVNLIEATYEQLRRLDNILYNTYNESTGGRR